MKSTKQKLLDTLAESEQFAAQMATPCDEATPEYEDGYQAAIRFAISEIEHAKQTTSITIQKAIRAHILENYGRSEASHPSWCIPALADAITAAINE